MNVRYALSGDVAVAYQVTGKGPDLVLVNGWVSHLDYLWTHPLFEQSLKRISSFCRLINFDKRGTGLSDRVSDLPDLQTRMDDVRAVMDAAGSTKAALLGISEGVPMCLLFAATYPERVSHLVLYGGMARSTATEDYPWAPDPEGLAMNLSFVHEWWGTGVALEVFAPSLAEDASFVEWWQGFERNAASPGAMIELIKMFAGIDVRAILPTIHVPTLVIHRKGDRVANYRGARWMADQIPNARYVLLPGFDHLPFAGDTGRLFDEVEEFVTGVRPTAVLDRVLATCLFTDIVGSTRRAAELGDARWSELLSGHHSAVRRQLDWFRGKEIKTIGDGFLATFDGPARGVACAKAIVREAATAGLEVRAGLHVGEIELQPTDVAGLAVHIAARISALAAGGQVLVSSTVKDLIAGSGIDFDDAGQHELKGLPGSWNLYSAA
jgi:class 3 adenylate cyclase/alpha-beta hydrolase superfamily lysophospholipase